MYTELTKQAEDVTREIVEKAGLTKGQIFVVGCSSSEICGDKIGTNSNLEVAQAVFKGIYQVLQEKGIYLAAQCCEHLNRAIIVERDAVPFSDIVNVVPQPKAGGSFASSLACSTVSTSFQSTPAYFLTASTIVSLSNGLLKSISIPL